MGRIQLGNRFIQDQNIRAQRRGSRQRQQVFLPAGQLPYIIIHFIPQAAYSERFFAFFNVIIHRIVQAGIRCVFQHGRTDNLIFKILIHISDFLRQGSYFFFLCIFTVNKNIPFHISCNEMGNQTVQRSAQSRFPAAIISNNCEKISLFNTDIDLL